MGVPLSKFVRSLAVSALATVLLVALPGTAGAQEPSPPDNAPDSVGQSFEITWEESLSDPAARAWSWGACAGNFSDIKKVNNRLEWGVENHCVGTGWIPHQITLVLQVQDGWLDYDDLFHRFSASALRQSPNISMYFHSEYECDTGTDTDYRMEAYVTAGSRTKVFGSDEFKVPCRF